jgi:hypothetical protein
MMEILEMDWCLWLGEGTQDGARLSYIDWDEEQVEMSVGFLYNIEATQWPVFYIITFMAGYRCEVTFSSSNSPHRYSAEHS